MSFCMNAGIGDDGDLHTAMAELRNNCDIAAKPTATTDAVSHPAHYTQGGIECIDAMESALTHEEFRGYLRGNCIKYLWRCELKGKTVQDLLKAAWYLDRLTREVERDA